MPHVTSSRAERVAFNEPEPMGASASAPPRGTAAGSGMDRPYSSNSLYTIPGTESPFTDGALATPTWPTAATTSVPTRTGPSTSPPLESSSTTSPAATHCTSTAPAGTTRSTMAARSPSTRTVRCAVLKQPPVCVSETCSAGEWVRLNVGGTTFTTTLATLCADPNSLLCAMCAPLTSRLRASSRAIVADGAPAVPASPVVASSRGSHVDPTSSGLRVEDSAPAQAVLESAGPLIASNSPHHTRTPTPASPTFTAVGDSASGGGGVTGGGESMNPHENTTSPTDKDVLPLDADAHNSLLLDLDPEYFAPVLNYLRHGTLLIPPACNPRGVLAVASYLNVQGVVSRLTPRPRVVPQYLFSWGSGSNGELGTQRLSDSDGPVHVRLMPFGVRAVHIALGANYSLALSDQGDVYGVGNADWGQLGLGNPKQLDVNPTSRSNVQLTPRRIAFFEQHPALTIAAGYAFAMAVTADHHVYFWGNNNHAQGGLGGEFLDPHFKKMDSPCLVRTLEGKQIVQVGCGSFFGLARSANGDLYSWGLLECAGLGTLEEVRQRCGGESVLGLALSNEGRNVVHTPQRITFPASAASSRITHIHAGQWHSGAINDRGELFTWGVGYQGRLGHGDKEPALTPRQVRGALLGHSVVDVACGSFHTVALTSRGAVFCWGDNASGQCGVSALAAASAHAPRQTSSPTSTSNPEAVTSPCRVVGLEFVAGGIACGVSCGRQHTAIIMQGPQPGCCEPCCQLDDRGKPRGEHRQVFVVGERLRTADKGGRAARSDSTTALGAEGRAFGASFAGHSGSLPSSRFLAPGRHHRSDATGPTHFAPLGGSPGQARYHADTELDYDQDSGVDGSFFPAVAFETPINQQFQRVPGLEALDVHRVVSGLHHTFVCAEAVRLSRADQELSATRFGAHDTASRTGDARTCSHFFQTGSRAEPVRWRSGDLAGAVDEDDGDDVYSEDTR